MSDEDDPRLHNVITIDGVYPFNRDDMIAAFLIKMCEEQRAVDCDEDDARRNETKGDYWSIFHAQQIYDLTAGLALLEGYARAWLNRYDDVAREGEIWRNMCNALANIGMAMWD